MTEKQFAVLERRYRAEKVRQVARWTGWYDRLLDDGSEPRRARPQRTRHRPEAKHQEGP